MMLLDGKSDLEMFKHRKQTWRFSFERGSCTLSDRIWYIYSIYKLGIRDNSKTQDQVVIYTFIFIIHQVDKYLT